MAIPFEFVEPWGAVAEEVRVDLERELLREVAPRHVLFGRPVRALARRRDSDDVLFELPDTGECSVVHLTWTKATTESPPLPYAKTYPGVHEWASTGMLRDGEEFESGG